ncbi:hypothetical protein [Roseiconus lacunae]|uniref:hypothetical protein n=1 Tax=Roseiconus lacunae TaxID=2605694 RepID=UPI001E3A42DB|nr:hypothetical protein [Roseiconus lacunae]MCD0461642.1 hypothetical protein [Roseiconus lacunae]
MMAPLRAGESAAPASSDPAIEQQLLDVIVVVGAGGTAEYATIFEVWAKKWQQNCERAGLSIRQIGPEPSDQFESTKDELQSVLAANIGGPTETEKETDFDAPLWIVLIGHGTWDGRVAKFNLVGPDASGSEFDAWLDPMKRSLVVANCTSSSAPFINRLSQPGRVVITATRNGGEHNFAMFGQFLAQAFASADADLDHDDEVSAMEAFIRASIETQRYYDEKGRLASEHALIDDNADKKGSAAELLQGQAKVKDGVVDGDFASQFSILVNPDLRPLTTEQRQKRDRLEAELQRLKQEFADRPKEELREAAIPVLLELASIYAGPSE